LFGRSQETAALLKARIILVHFEDIKAGAKEILDHLSKINSEASIIVCCEDEKCQKMKKELHKRSDLTFVDHDSFSERVPSLLSQLSNSKSWWKKTLKRFIPLRPNSVNQIR